MFLLQQNDPTLRSVNVFPLTEPHGPPDRARPYIGDCVISANLTKNDLARNSQQERCRCTRT